MTKAQQKEIVDRIRKLPNKPGIYAICFKHHVYVGRAYELRIRVQGHFSLLRRGEHTNPKLLAVMQEIGLEFFEAKVLELSPFAGKERQYIYHHPESDWLQARESYYTETLSNLHMVMPSMPMYGPDRRDLWEAEYKEEDYGE